MIVMTLKSHTPRPGFQVDADRLRPSRPSGSGDAAANLAPAPAPAPAPAVPAESTYLRQWIAHQATTYNNLLETIAAAPASHSRRNHR